MPESIKITVYVPNKIKLPLNVRKSIDGNLMIFSHPDCDIVLQPGNKKILVMSKDEYGDHVYGAADRLFRYLTSKGVVDPASVQAGNVYSSMEGKILDSIYGEEGKIALYAIAKFIEEEKPYFEMEKKYQQDREDELLYPDEEDTTELGEVPQEPDKGSLKKSNLLARTVGGSLYENKSVKK